MRKRLSGCLGLLGLFPASLLVAQPEDAPATHLVDEVASLVTEHFHDPNRLDAEWQAAVARARIKAALPGQETTSSAIVNEMLAALSTSHTAHYSPDDIAYYHILGIFAHVPQIEAFITDHKAVFTP